ncbi:hypothetical protein LX32DRAFT_294421 [Colletotrichum zoysiae]|uniref:Uncharacterized protein n=1 Tax=Colletotrichum zoysiae TaxID=1216348 RepID=A0AAD9H3D8_9PEZI|nr:hypothetical protein LX32DRAFT_294421 [Colletotrichum zoysiae]
MYLTDTMYGVAGSRIRPMFELECHACDSIMPPTSPFHSGPFLLNSTIQSINESINQCNQCLACTMECGAGSDRVPSHGNCKQVRVNDPSATALLTFMRLFLLAVQEITCRQLVHCAALISYHSLTHSAAPKLLRYRPSNQPINQPEAGTFRAVQTEFLNIGSIMYLFPSRPDARRSQAVRQSVGPSEALLKTGTAPTRTVNVSRPTQPDLLGRYPAVTACSSVTTRDPVAAAPKPSPLKRPREERALCVCCWPAS